MVYCIFLNVQYKEEFVLCLNETPWRCAWMRELIMKIVRREKCGYLRCHVRFILWKERLFEGFRSSIREEYRYWMPETVSKRNADYKNRPERIVRPVRCTKSKRMARNLQGNLFVFKTVLAVLVDASLGTVCINWIEAGVRDNEVPERPLSS